MTQPDFTVGPLTFYFYGLFIAFALLVLYFYIQKRAKLYQLKTREMESAYLISIVFALIGARTYHVFSLFSYYLHFPLKIFFVWEGGLGIFGAIAGGVIGVSLYCRRHKINILNMLDLMAPPLLLAQAIGRLGNFFNHESFGPPTSLPWKMFVPIEYRPPQFLSFAYFHPTFFYESLLCLIAFFIFVFFLKKKSLGFAYYLLSYGIIRFLTEFWRWDTWAWNGVKVALLLAAGMAIVGLFGLYDEFQK